MLPMAREICPCKDHAGLAIPEDRSAPQGDRYQRLFTSMIAIASPAG
jgi:hypothetical protein